MVVIVKIIIVGGSPEWGRGRAGWARISAH